MFRAALAMRESLYPKDRYPRGHPDLATSLNNLGDLLRAQGDYGGARGTTSGHWRCSRPSTSGRATRRGTPTSPRA